MPSPTATKKLIDDYLRNPDSLGIASASANFRLVHDAHSGLEHVRMVFSANTQIIAAGDNAAKAGGFKMLTLPIGLYVPIASMFYGSIVGDQTDANNTAGEIGIGTVVGSGANATLGAVGATAENFMEGYTIGNMTAGAAVVIAGAVDSGREVIGSVSGTTDLYLNLATTFGNYGTAQNISVVSGSFVDMWFVSMLNT